MFWCQKNNFSDAKQLRYLQVIFCHVIGDILIRFWPSKDSILTIIFGRRKSVLKHLFWCQKNNFSDAKHLRYLQVIFCHVIGDILKFIYSEKATIFCEISTADLTVKVHIFWEGHKILQNLPLTFDYSKRKILQNFVAFSEYMKLTVGTVKSTLEISQNFVAFSEYMNFN